MSVQVKNGTPPFGPSLCETCTRAHIVRGYRESELLVFCCIDSPMHRLLFRVRECNDYIDKNRQTLFQMEKTAWILAPRRPKRKAGFVPSGELTNEDGEIELTLEQE